MDKVLVAIDSRRGAWGALSHACSLAKRIQVDLHVLLVTPPGTGRGDDAQRGPAELVRQRLELHLAAAKTEGITINYFMTEGTYEEEVIKFVSHHKIALLVHESREGDARSAAKEAIALRALRHRLTCKMEVVAPLKTIAETNSKRMT